MNNVKCSLAIEQIEDRLRYEPNIVELQVFEGDIRNPNRIIQVIQLFQERKVKVYLHHPMKVNGKFLDILSKDPEVFEFYRSSCSIIYDICESEDILCVVHPHYEKCVSGMADTSNENYIIEKSIELKNAIQEIRNHKVDRFLWENAPTGIFSSLNPYWLANIVEPIQLPLCYDISHAFMSFRGDNDKLENEIISTYPFTHHYHVVDSKGTEIHDALSLGLGNIDWLRFKKYILNRDFIFEVDLPNYNDCTPMIESAGYFYSL